MSSEKQDRATLPTPKGYRKGGRYIIGRVAIEATPPVVAFIGRPDAVSLRFIASGIAKRCKRLSVSDLRRIWVFDTWSGDPTGALHEALVNEGRNKAIITRAFDPQMVAVSRWGAWERDIRSLVVGNAPRFGAVIFGVSQARGMGTKRIVDILAAMLADTTRLLFLDSAPSRVQASVDTLCRMGWMGTELADMWILQRRTLALKE